MATTPQPISSTALYPSATQATLRQQYVGQQLRDVQAPAAVLDAAVVRRNCALMLDAAARLGVGFRAHVKTHKTVEITKLQVGEAPLPVKLVASTVAEIEHLLPWLLDCRRQGREVNVLYGLPVAPSAVPRLARVASALGEGTVGLFVDHPDHVRAIAASPDGSWPGRIPIFVNIDVGEHREGVPAHSRQLAEVVAALAEAPRVQLKGLYAYLNSSYSSSSPDEALDYLAKEFEGLVEGLKAFAVHIEGTGASDASRLTLSVGATPTATAAQNLLQPTPNGERCRELIKKLGASYDVELHAGVYTVLDLQQLATRARPLHTAGDATQTLLSHRDLGFRVLAEVVSEYRDRVDRPEALIAAGGIALGREPCKDYPGWAVVTPWPESQGAHYDLHQDSRTGWIVGRISQEHGILTWEGPTDGFRALRVGQKVMLWPNHACIAGVNHGWYLVVDSDKPDANEVQDVWLRWRGW